jgi:hypothetical protein
MVCGGVRGVNPPQGAEAVRASTKTGTVLAEDDGLDASAVAVAHFAAFMA